MIHPTAVIHPGAVLGANISIGPYSVIGEKVVLGDNCEIGPHVTIEGATTIGAGANDQTSVTISTSGCVDQAPSFAVTAIDSAGNTRAVAAPTTITHSFPTTLLVTWTTNSTGSLDTNSGDGCPVPSPRPPIMQCSGYCVNAWFTTITVSYTGACSKPTTVNITNSDAGCCGSGAWWSGSNYIGTGPSGTVSSNPFVVFNGSGSAGLTISRRKEQSTPSVSFVISNSDFPRGLTYTGTVNNSGTVTLVDTINWAQ